MNTTRTMSYLAIAAISLSIGAGSTMAQPPRQPDGINSSALRTSRNYTVESPLSRAGTADVLAHTAPAAAGQNRRHGNPPLMGNDLNWMNGGGG